MIAFNNRGRTYSTHHEVLVLGVEPELNLYLNNLVLFLWFGYDTEEQTEPEPFKYNLALVLFLVLFDHQLLQVYIQTKLTELC